MSSSLHHIQFLFKLEPLHCSIHETIRRTNRKISGKQVFKLQAIKRREDSLLKRMIRRYFSPHDEHMFRLCKLAENHVNESIKNNEAEEEVLVNEIQNSQSHSRYAADSNGNGPNGNNRGNGNDNGNGGDHGGDEGQENKRDDYPGIEWWWWWKWQQACCKTQNGSTRSNMWPVDVAVQAVANEVMENIEPAVQALVVEPIRQHIITDGFIFALVFGVLLISSIQMVVGLAIVSMGVSLAGLAAIALALLWWSWKRRGSQSQHDNEDDNGE